MKGRGWLRVESFPEMDGGGYRPRDVVRTRAVNQETSRSGLASSTDDYKAPLCSLLCKQGFSVRLSSTSLTRRSPENIQDGCI